MADRQQVFLRMVLSAWESQVQRADKLFKGFTDEQFEQEIAPGRNRVIYLLGHLVAVNDSMLTLLRWGDRHFANLDQAFITSPDRAITDLPSLDELKSGWSSSLEKINEGINSMTPDGWFERHNSVSEADFEKEPHRNRLNIMMSRTNHLHYHIGQLVLVK